MIVVTALHLATMIILARFLPAEDFGLMAIMMVVIGFSQAFADMGISNAIIQRQDVTHNQLSSLYWLNVMSGSVIMVLVMLAAPLVAGFYERPELQGLLLQLSCVFLILSIGNQYRVLCQKNMQFGRMAAGEIFAAFCAFSIAVFCAVNGMGVKALVYGMIAQAVAGSLYFLVMGLKYHHRPAFVYKHSELSGYFGFGLYQMGEKSINYLGANMDNLIIGKFLGMQALGFYNLAWQLCQFPVQKINLVVNKVAFPVYARLQEDTDALNRQYASFLRAISIITIPVLTFLFYFAPDVIAILYGQGWELTAKLVPVLALVGIIKTIGNPGGALFLALGRADIGFWWNVFWILFVGSGLLVTVWLSDDIQNVALAMMGMVLVAGIIWHSLVARVAHINYRFILLHLAQIFFICFAIGGAASIVTSALALESAFFNVLLGGILCLISYGLYFVRFENKTLSFLRQEHH